MQVSQKEFRQMEDKPTENLKQNSNSLYSTPFRCVVCNGFGSLKWGSKTCQACNGKGYILVPRWIDEGEKDGLDQKG